VAAIKRNHAHGHDDEQAVHQKEDV
jgi:hypothetical protein